MRPRFYSQQNPFLHHDLSTNSNKDIFKSIHQQLKDLTFQSRLQLAIEHFQDALYYRIPRINIQISESNTCSINLMEKGYRFQTSQYWRKFLLVISYIFMYIVFISHNKPGILQTCIELSVIVFLWIDFTLQLLYRNCLPSRKALSSLRFYMKLVIIISLTGDEVIALASQDNVFRPFLVLRASLPIFFSAQLRKYFQSIASLYKDIFVYVIFYSLVLAFFAIVANQLIQIPSNIKYDQFTQNYQSVSNSMFLFYIMSTYDSFPDNQLLAIEYSPIIIVLFVSFLFFNMLIFSTIPSSYLFKSFRQFHSKTILIDQLKQQNSLIMAFVTLTQNSQLRISQSKFLIFLYRIYKNQIGYVDYITQISLQINKRKSKYIQIFEFIKLCKIIQSNSRMQPPFFNQCELWANIKQKINQKLELQHIVKSNKFDTFIAILVLLSIANSIVAFYHETQLFYLFYMIFISIFGLEILVKILGFGLRSYFSQSQNMFDFLIETTLIILQAFNSDLLLPHIKTVLMVLRFYKLPLLGKQFAQKRDYIKKNQIYIKTARLFSQIIITFPIVLSFLPVFAIISYFLGTLGMTLFAGETQIQPEESPYSKYNDYSNFQSLFSTQSMIVQVLIEAGWSFLAFDYAYRSRNSFLSLPYFILCHLLIVFLLTSITKGLIWQVYNAVHDELNSKMQATIKKQSSQLFLTSQRQQLAQLSFTIEQNKQIVPKTILSRQIIQQKLDKQIFQFMVDPNVNKNITNLYQQHYLNYRNVFSLDYVVDEIDQLQDNHNEEEVQHPILQKLNNQQEIQNIQDIHRQDIQNYSNILSEKLKTNFNSQNIFMQYPPSLENYLKNKLKIVYSNNSTHISNDQNNILNTTQTVSLIKSSLKSLMQMKSTRNRQLINNIAHMIKQCGINIQTERVLQSYKDKTYHPFDGQWILRKGFLSNTSQKLIKKFQFAYFHNIYPQIFADSASNIILNPLLTQESKLVYCLRNLLRYHKITTKQFFHQLSSIQSRISSNMFRKGSFFKFVFQINNNTENWFTIESLVSQSLSFHFLKNGIWIYYPFIQQLNIYHCKDIFSIKTTPNHNLQLNKKLIKLLFQSFQVLALGMSNNKDFFSFNPIQQTYDLYFVTKMVQLQLDNISISKVMALILSNEGDRSEVLDYQLTKMEMQEQKHSATFRLDQSQKQTLEKLKKLQFIDDELAEETSGLPFEFIVNFMVEIKDILTSYSDNLVMQVEKVLNRKSSLLRSSLSKI